MNALMAAKSGPVERCPSDLEGKLQWLRRFGRPRLNYLTTGWVAAIDMNTNAQGTAFEVKSDFGMAGPVAAIDQMIERMLAALAAVGGANG